MIDPGLTGVGAVVTGAGAGIGRAVAEDLARQGARLLLVARRTGPLEETAERIVAAGGLRPVVLAGDLAEPGAARRIANAARSELGGVGVLVNNAGQADPPGGALDEAGWQRSFELNFHVKRRLAQELRPDLEASRRGRVVNLVGLLEPTVVSAAQAAIAACRLWSKAFSREVAAAGVTVNCVAPGRIDSEQVRRHFPTPDSRARYAAAHVPAGRFGAPAEAAALVTFLCSARAAYLTGQTVAVDGGLQRHA
ncbi:SDR family oxidoreductase [Micromonospora sp. NPDC050686]|uniref:SDR family NAD(P)-dependent oxidoreductase n=1 Tax=Micromonospora sp. NPDC050686 TaxID=3154631 RepID=UPI0033EDAE3A